MSKKDIVDELMNEWEAAKMDTPHGLPAFKKAADEILRLREEIKRLRDAVYDVLDSARGGDYGEVVWDEEDFDAFEKLIDKIEKEVGDE